MNLREILRDIFSSTAPPEVSGLGAKVQQELARLQKEAAREKGERERWQQEQLEERARLLASVEQELSRLNEEALTRLQPYIDAIKRVNIVPGLNSMARTYNIKAPKYYGREVSAELSYTLRYGEHGQAQELKREADAATFLKSPKGFIEKHSFNAARPRRTSGPHTNLLGPSSPTDLTNYRYPEVVEKLRRLIVENAAITSIQMPVGFYLKPGSSESGGGMDWSMASGDTWTPKTVEVYIRKMGDQVFIGGEPADSANIQKLHDSIAQSAATQMHSLKTGRT